MVMKLEHNMGLEIFYSTSLLFLLQMYKHDNENIFSQQHELFLNI